MNKKIIVFFGFSLFLSFTSFAYAEEFNFKSIDSLDHIISYELINSDLIDINQEPTSFFKFIVNGSDGMINVKLPKTLPILNSEKYPNLVLINGEEILNDIHDDTECYYNYNIKVNNKTEIEFIFVYWPERPLPVYYLSIDPSCDLQYDKSIVDKQNRTCKHENYFKVENNRNEIICLQKNSTFNKLIERGYLIPTEVVITSSS